MNLLKILIAIQKWQSGHGKLLANPNLEDTGFATNVKSGAIYKIDIPTRAFVSTVALNNNTITTQGYSCVGTHGIDYSSVNNRIYVECSNPSNCPSSKDDSKTCTGYFLFLYHNKLYCILTLLYIGLCGVWMRCPCK